MPRLRVPLNRAAGRGGGVSVGKYIAGASVLRFPGRPAVLPGEWFVHDYDEPQHETMALASGAITLQPGETSLADQAAQARAAAEAAVAVIETNEEEDGAHAVAAPQNVDGMASAPPSERSGPASRRRTTKNKE